MGKDIYKHRYKYSEAQAPDLGTVARVPAADGVLIVLECSLALDLSKLTG